MTIMMTGIHAVTLVSAITIPHGAHPGDGMDAFIQVIGIHGIHLLSIHIMDTLHTIPLGIHTLLMGITQHHMAIIIILANIRHAILVIRGVEIFGGMAVL
jgi:hypothetical protein